MSSGLSVSGIDFVPDPSPTRVVPAHVDRAYRTEGALSAITDRARSGNEGWLVEMVWELIQREDAMALLADLEAWGTRESFRIYIPGEDEAVGDATETQLDGLRVASRTGTSTSSDVRFNAHASQLQTIVRNDAGSWITDGFEVGMKMVTTGAEDSANDDTRWLETVSATTLTLSADSPAVVGNASDTTVAITGSFDHKGRHLAVETSPVVASTLLLRKGCFIGWTVDGKYEMARLRENLTTDASGNAVAKLSQYIRTPPAAAAAIFTRYIPLRVTLASSTGYEISSPILYNFRIRMREEPGAT